MLHFPTYVIQICDYSLHMTENLFVFKAIKLICSSKHFRKFLSSFNLYNIYNCNPMISQNHFMQQFYLGDFLLTELSPLMKASLSSINALPLTRNY